MEKGAYKAVPGGEIELAIQSDDEETPSGSGTPIYLVHTDDAITIRERSPSAVNYGLLFVFVSTIMVVTIFSFPVDRESLDSSHEKLGDLPRKKNESSHEPIMPPLLPIATSYPGLAPIQMPTQSYVGPTLPDEITTCPDLLFYHELQNDVSQGKSSFCDDMGTHQKECLSCQNPTISKKHDDDWIYQKRWDKTLLRNLGLVKQYENAQLDVLLLGDSLTEHWLGTDLGRQNPEYDEAYRVYQQYFQDNATLGLALGIGGDRCPQLLYRMEQGEIVTSAKVIWINIGTNDLGGDHCTLNAVVAGNIAVVEYVLNAINQNKTKVVLNSLLPRCGGDANDTYLMKDRNWQEIRRINKYLECYAISRASTALEFFDATSLFLSRDDSNYRNATLYQDPVHLSAEGYRIWGKAIVQRVEEIKANLSRDDTTSSLPLCGETNTANYYDDLVKRASTTPASRCEENQLCQCADPQIPTTNESRMHAWWKKAFQRNQEQLIPFLETNSTVELMLMGDSITELWLGTVFGIPSPKYIDIPEVFKGIFSNKSTVAMGISADKSPYLLHRIQNGEVPLELNVSVVWVLIGTNDISDGCNADAVAAANIIVAKEIMRRQPKARVVINSLLPRMNIGDDVIPVVNSKLKCFAESTGGSIAFFDATNLFVNSDGTTNTDLYIDGVHPNKKGYEIWGRAIKNYTLFSLR